MNKAELTTEQMNAALLEIEASGPRDINQKLFEYEKNELEDDIHEENEDLRQEALDEYHNSGRLYDEWHEEFVELRIKALYVKLRELCKDAGQ